MENESGIWPVEYKCLIQLLPREEVTEAGIILTSMTAEKDQMAREVGVFVVAGGNAFSDPKWQQHAIPKPGQKVLFDRYAGSVQKGMDDKDYRVLSDNNIGALLEEDYGC